MAGDEEQDSVEKFFRKPETNPAADGPGQFTRAFFGPEASQPQMPDKEYAAGVEPGNMPSSPKPSMPAPPAEPPAGTFTRLFGRVEDEAVSEPKEKPVDYGYSSGQSRMPGGDAGTLTDLFARQNQEPIKPVNPQSNTFTNLFNSFGSEKPSPEPAQLSTLDYELASKDSGGDPLGKPRIASPAPEPPAPESIPPAVAMGTPNQRSSQDKATRLFAASPPDPLNQLSIPPAGQSGPSAFTRIIRASDLRSAQENTSGAGNNPPAPPVSANPAPQAPASAWPAMPPQIIPAAPPTPSIQMPHIQMPQPSPPPQPMPVQISMPSVAPPVWPQMPASAPIPPPAAQNQFPPLEQQTTQQKWITYLPLIIGLNLLFFLAVILILIFALNK